jgi:hypothetical protein
MRKYGNRNCAECGDEFAARGTRDKWCSVKCRFWSHVDRSAGPDACWPWTAALFTVGYGQMTVDGVPYYAHRMALMLSGIRIPDDMYGIHECDNKICCNPHERHVIVGTPRKNSLDAHARGRRPTVNYATGDRHGMRKLRLQREAAL